MRSRTFVLILVPVMVLAGAYSFGPKPSTPAYRILLPDVPEQPDALEAYVSKQESKHKVKPDNNAIIVWNDSSRQKTDYAVVYLHGFSASRMEGDPVHQRFAKEFGCNLYLARLADHGIDTTEALLQFTPDRAWESAKQALMIGKRLGHKVILMSTSTGGTLALKLAAEYPEDVSALINMSPNIALKNPAAFIANDPWGLQVAHLVVGSDYNESDPDGESAKYWYSRYRLEAVCQLEELLETTMNEKLFSRVKQPSLSLYYFKDEEEQDPQVKVSAILEMNEQLGTPSDKKFAIDVPDAGAHVLGSSLTSHDVEGVYAHIGKFATGTLGLKRVP